MFRKSIFASFILVAFTAIACAQTAPIRGRVEMIDADGKKVPVVGAKIEVFRTDTKGKLPEATTDKKGVFTFAGLPLGGTFVISVSGKGVSPEIYPNVKAGREDILITARVGDGKQFTQEEVREAILKPTTSGTSTQGGDKQEMSPEDKKKKEEYDKKVAEITAKNTKVGENNELIRRVLKEGNDALNATNYDLAVAKYQEGINADSTHPGAPVLMTNKSVALRIRGTDRFNKAIKISAPTDEAKADFEVSKDSAKAAIDLLNSQTPPTDVNELTNYKGYKLNALSAYISAMRIFVKNVDPSKSEDLFLAFQEYLVLEIDPVKKSTNQLEYAQSLMDNYFYDKAVIEFQKTLDTSPNNIDALFGYGLSTWTIAYVIQDKYKNASSQEKQSLKTSEFVERYQIAANNLAKYMELAPNPHKNRAAATETLDSLKNIEKITPQKLPKK